MKKNLNIWIVPIIMIGLFMILQIGCKKSSSSSSTQPSNAGPDVTDVDGNVYHSVVIGTQTWMASNLKVTKYRNGTAIPNVSDSAQWVALTTGAYCVYNNDPTMVSTYGLLYNWYAAGDSVNILAPQGWHVPTDAEWTTLTTYLGASAGGKLKETGTKHWDSPNSGATDATNFTALPGADRSYTGVFHNMGIYGFWWTSSYSGINGIDRIMTDASANVFSINYPMDIGFSVRCVKD
ncbi:MAG: fibrobacter succinogenes major paralogous domain-containing protein [Bacteroidales bacterium]|jgi:uncharacterized protein (TIGR02145 family)